MKKAQTRELKGIVKLSPRECAKNMWLRYRKGKANCTNPKMWKARREIVPHPQLLSSDGKKKAKPTRSLAPSVSVQAVKAAALRLPRGHGHPGVGGDSGRRRRQRQQLGSDGPPPQAEAQGEKDSTSGRNTESGKIRLREFHFPDLPFAKSTYLVAEKYRCVVWFGVRQHIVTYVDIWWSKGFCHSYTQSMYSCLITCPVCLSAQNVKLPQQDNLHNLFEQIQHEFENLSTENTKCALLRVAEIVISDLQLLWNANPYWCCSQYEGRSSISTNKYQATGRPVRGKTPPRVASKQRVYHSLLIDPQTNFAANRK